MLHALDAPTEAALRRPIQSDERHSANIGLLSRSDYGGIPVASLWIVRRANAQLHAALPTRSSTRGELPLLMPTCPGARLGRARHAE